MSLVNFPNEKAPQIHLPAHHELLLLAFGWEWWPSSTQPLHEILQNSKDVPFAISHFSKLQQERRPIPLPSSWCLPKGSREEQTFLPYALSLEEVRKTKSLFPFPCKLDEISSLPWAFWSFQRRLKREAKIRSHLYFDLEVARNSRSSLGLPLCSH